MFIYKNTNTQLFKYIIFKQKKLSNYLKKIFSKLLFLKNF